MPASGRSFSSALSENTVIGVSRVIPARPASSIGEFDQAHLLKVLRIGLAYGRRLSVWRERVSKSGSKPDGQLLKRLFTQLIQGISVNQNAV